MTSFKIFDTFTPEEQNNISFMIFNPSAVQIVIKSDKNNTTQTISVELCDLIGIVEYLKKENKNWED
jgi:hypothetical protein